MRKGRGKNKSSVCGVWKYADEPFFEPLTLLILANHSFSGTPGYILNLPKDRSANN